MGAASIVVIAAALVLTTRDVDPNGIQEPSPTAAAERAPIAIATVPVGTTPAGVATTGTAVWVTNLNGRTVIRIDPATNETTATISVGDLPMGVQPPRSPSGSPMAPAAPSPVSIPARGETFRAPATRPAGGLLTPDLGPAIRRSR